MHILTQAVTSCKPLLASICLNYNITIARMGIPLAANIVIFFAFFQRQQPHAVGHTLDQGWSALRGTAPIA